MATPINLSLIDNKIELIDDNSELMEFNDYEINIQTNKDLSGYNLFYKLYGATEVTKVEENEKNFKENYSTRLFYFNTSSDEENYWGYFFRKERFFSINQTVFKDDIENDLGDFSSEGKIIIGNIYKYIPIETPTVVPKRLKKEDYRVDCVGYIIASYTGNDSGEWTLGNEGILKLLESNDNNSIDNTNLFESIEDNLIISKDLSNIPMPPQIEDELIIAKKVYLSGEFLGKGYTDLAISKTEDMLDITFVTKDEDKDGIFEQPDESVTDGSADDTFWGDDPTEEIEIDETDENISSVSKEDLENDIELELNEDEKEELETDSFPDEDDTREPVTEDFVEDKKEQIISFVFSAKKLEFDFVSYNEEIGKYFYKFSYLFENQPPESLDGEDEENTFSFEIYKDESSQEQVYGNFSGEIVLSFDEKDFSICEMEISGKLNYNEAFSPEEPTSSSEEVLVTLQNLELSNNIIDYNNIDYSDFSFDLEENSKNKYLTILQNYLNLYVINLPKEIIRSEVDRFFIGVGKEENQEGKKNYSDFTNEILLTIKNSMVSSTNWDVVNFSIPNGAYIMGYYYYDESKLIGKFYEDKDRTKEILGRSQVVYLDITKEVDKNINIDEIFFYAWEPFNGFYRIYSKEEEVTNKEL